MWYNKRILKWNVFKGALVLIILFSALLVEGVASRKIGIVHFYFEALLPFIFSFTTTHIIMSDKESGVLEIVLSKPVSRLGLLLKRYLLIIVPNLIVVVILLLILSHIYRDMNLPKLMFVSLSTVVFMCTLSMTAGLMTKASRYGAVISSLWFIFWVNGDIQDKIGTTGIFGLINPFMYGFHSNSSLLFPSKFALLIISTILFSLCVLILNKSERLI